MTASSSIRPTSAWRRTSRRIEKHNRAISTTRRRIVYTSRGSVVGVAVGDAIVARSTEIAELHYVHVVIIFGILPRMPPTRFKGKRRTRVDFNSIFQQANDQIRKASATLQLKNYVFGRCADFTVTHFRSSAESARTAHILIQTECGNTQGLSEMPS